MTSFALTVTNGYSSDMSVDTGKVGTNGYCGYDGAMTIRPGETKEGMQWTDPDAASNCDVPFTVRARSTWSTERTTRHSACAPLAGTCPRSPCHSSSQPHSPSFWPRMQDSHGFDTVVRVLFPEYGEPLLEVIQNAKIDGPSAVTIVDWSP